MSASNGSSSSDDDIYFQSAFFFLDLNSFYFICIGSIHLTHWFVNLYIEYKNTRSCGTTERREGMLGYLLLVISFSIPLAVIVWITIDIPVRFLSLN